MNAVAMVKRTTGVSPRFKARMASILFLLLLLTSSITEFFARGRLSFVPHLAAGIIEVSCLIAVTLLLYSLFKPVDRRLSLLALSFNFLALALLLLRFQPYGVNIGLGFHGFYWILIGYLIFKSTFLPRMLGVLTAIAGLCWLTFLSPSLAKYLSPYNLGCAFLVEALMMVWLLVTTFSKWEEKAGSLAEPGIAA